MEHIQVTLALLYFKRHNELKEAENETPPKDNETAQIQDETSQVHDETTVRQSEAAKAQDDTGQSHDKVATDDNVSTSSPEERNKSLQKQGSDVSKISENDRDGDLALVASHIKEAAINVLTALKDDDVEELDNLPRSIETLKKIVDARQGSGVTYTILGNILFLERTPAEAKNYLQKAVSLGLSQIPLHVRHHALHHLATEARTVPVHDIMKCEKLFELLVASNKDGYFISYLIYAAYLLSLCEITEGKHEKACNSFEEIVELVGHCSGKDALLGVLCMKSQQYARAQKAFEAEIKAQYDCYEKLSLLQSMAGICHFADVIHEAIHPDKAKHIVQEWFNEISNEEAVLHLTTRNLNHVYSIEQSAAGFITQIIPKNPEIAELLSQVKIQEMLKVLCTILVEDKALGATHFQLCLSQIQRYEALPQGDRTSDLLMEIQNSFETAEKQKLFPIHSASFDYSCFLIRQGKYEMAREWILKSHKECLRVLNNYVADKSSETETIVNYVLGKCLGKCLQVIPVVYACLCQPKKLIEILNETFAVTCKVNGYEGDIVACACGCVADLVALKQMDALIYLHEYLVENFQESVHASSLGGNLACYLFGRMRSSNQEQKPEASSTSDQKPGISTITNQNPEISTAADQIPEFSTAGNRKQGTSATSGQNADILDSPSYSRDDPALLVRIHDIFESVIATGSPSASTYADFMNFLHNTQQHEKLIELWKNVKTTVSQMPPSKNEYSAIEKPTVDIYLQHEIDPKNVVVDAFVYCVYLNACSEYKLHGKVEDGLVQLEDLAKKDNSAWKLVGYVSLLMGNKEAAREAIEKVVASDPEYKWMISLYFD